MSCGAVKCGEGATENTEGTEANSIDTAHPREAQVDVGAECFVDCDDEPDPELNRITNAVIGAAIEVHSRLGPGHLESSYEEAMAIEMTLRGIHFERQVDVDLMYKGHAVGKGRLDFRIEGTVILDLKAVQQLAPIHTSQMVSYLSITGCPLGLIINFNVVALRQGIKRIARRRAAGR